MIDFLLFKFIKSDIKGQLSLEYILTSIIVILILCSLSIPILNLTIDYSTDVVDSLNAKSQLNKICDAIDFCYSSGKGSKKVVLVNFNKDVTINFLNNNSKGLASINMIVSKNESNIISYYFNYPSLRDNIFLSKGFSKLLIEWGEDSDVITISKIL